MIRKNKFTIVTAMVILYLSLAGSITFGQSGILNIPYIDKIGHFGLYFTLMSVIILEHKNLFQNTRQLLLVALIPFFFGNLIEILQMTLTSNRKGEILDALANSAGITIALFLWLFVKPYYKQEFKK
jgi:VanZ family protein